MILALLLAVVSGVQYKSALAATSASLTATVTPTATTTANNTVVLSITYSKCPGCGTPHTVSTVTDTGGSTYALRAGPIQSSVGAVTEIWGTTVAAAHASTSATVTIAGSATAVDIQLGLAEYAGVVVYGTPNTNTATGVTASVAITSQNAANWLVGGMYNDSCGNTFTAVSGTIRAQDNGAGCTISGDMVLMDIGPASGSQTLSWSDASAAWQAAAVELCAQTPCSGSAAVAATPGRRSTRGAGR